VPRRVALPGADELFRATTADTRAPGDAEAADGSASEPPATRRPALTSVEGRGDGRGTTGRQRHEEKITVYVSPQELIDLEQTRLTLRAAHGLGIDRGRIVREALSVVLADFEAKGADSILVRRLRG
jgi:hypothetical protein